MRTNILPTSAAYLMPMSLQDNTHKYITWAHKSKKYVYIFYINKDLHETISLANIKNAVEDFFKVNISIRTRKQETVEALKIFMFFAYKVFETNKSCTYIGKFVERDHSTVLHHANTIIDSLDINDKETIEALSKVCFRLGCTLIVKQL